MQKTRLTKSQEAALCREQRAIDYLGYESLMRASKLRETFRKQGIVSRWENAWVDRMLLSELCGEWGRICH